MFIRFFSEKHSQKGFTLPEIMIGGAILAGVALAAATIFKNQSKSQAQVQHDMVLAQFHASLAKILDNDHNCNATFRSLGKYGAPDIGSSDDIDTIRLCDTSIGGNCVATSTAQNTVAMATPFIREGDWIDRNPSSSKQIWRLDRIEYANGPISETGSLQLRFTYSLNPRIANRTVSKDVNVNLRFSTSGSGFQECFNDQESSVNNLQNDMCKSFFNSVSGVSSDGQLVYWDEVSQTCKLRGVDTPILKDCSSFGMMVMGIRSDGTVHCRSLTEGFDPSPLTNTTGCAATSKVQLEWVGSKVKVKCVP